jgi:hypothetical protein
MVGLLAGDTLMLPVELIEAFNVLAQSTDDLIRYFPPGDGDLLYRRDDEYGGYDDVAFPSKVAALTCASIMHEQFPRIANETVRKIASEIECMIAIMLELPSQYHWGLNKDTCWIQGPNDASWDILRRLSSFGLTATGTEVQPPQHSFGEFIKLGQFSEWKIVPVAGDQGQVRGEL